MEENGVAKKRRLRWGQSALAVPVHCGALCWNRIFLSQSNPEVFQPTTAGIPAPVSPVSGANFLLLTTAFTCDN